MPPVPSRRVRRPCVAATTAILALGVVAPAADAACKNYQHRAKFESGVFKTDLAYLNLKMRVCYNGRRITKVSGIDAYPSTTNNAVGAITWSGLDQNIRQYRVWKGRKKGAYFIKVGSTFTQDISVPVVGGTKSAKFLSVTMKVFGNGQVTKDRQNG